MRKREKGKEEKYKGVRERGERVEVRKEHDIRSAEGRKGGKKERKKYCTRKSEVSIIKRKARRTRKMS